jgi:succinoglycan biosynthesis transport protein ExoP
MTIQQFLLVLRARWKIVASVFVVVVLSTLTISLILPKKYSATAAVLLDVKVTDPISGTLLAGMVTPGYMATQVDIINSDRVAQRVVQLIKLDEVPAFKKQWQESTQGRGSVTAWLGDLIQQRLEVKPSRESNVINIAFSWPDSKAAALFANTYAKAYIDTSLELKVDPAKQYATWFDERGKQVKETLGTAQKKLSDYQREKGIVASDERLDVENARLNELSSQLVSIQAQRSDTQSRQRQTSGNKDNLPEVLQSPLIAGLKSDLAKAEARREDVIVRLGKNHPEYQRTDSEIASLRERIVQETARIATSMGTANQVNVQRESDVRAELEAQKRKVLAIKQQRDEIMALENDVTSAQHTYDLVTQRLAQTNLESQTQQTNVVLLNPADEPVSASSPKIFVNTLISIFVGLLLGVGAALMFELLDQRVRNGEDLTRLLDVPLLGTLREVSRNVSRQRERRWWWPWRRNRATRATAVPA